MRRDESALPAPFRRASRVSAPRRPAPEAGGPRRRLRRVVFLCLLLGAFLAPAVAAPRVLNPVFVQAKKDVGAKRLDAAIPALEELLKSEIDKTTRSDSILLLGQAYIDRASALSRAKDDAGASAVYDTAIALIEPFLGASQDRRTIDSADKLLSQAYMSNADSNIRLKNYDKALLSLQSFSAKYPERFDQANDKVKSIFVIRQQYTKLASDIRDRALASNGADPAIGGMIDKLRGLDPYANKTILTTLVEVQTKVRNLALLKATMTKARAQADKGDFAGALETYLSGFAPESTLPALFYTDFVTAGYDMLEKRDADTGQIVAMGTDGRPQVLALDSTGRVLRTDAEGRPVRGFGGLLFVNDSKGVPLKKTLRDIAGQRQIDRAESVVAAVEAVAGSAGALANSLGGSQGKSAVFSEAMASLRASLEGGDLASIAQALPRAEKAFADLNADRTALARANSTLVDFLNVLPKVHVDGTTRSLLDYSYLSYVGFFLRGRQAVQDYDNRDPKTDPLWRPEPERDVPEGMTGILFTQAAAALDAAELAWRPHLDSGWVASLAAWDAGDWPLARAGFDRMLVLGPTARTILALWRELGKSGPASGLGAGDLARASGKEPDIAVLDSLAAVAESSSRLAGLRQAVAELRGGVGTYAASLRADPPLADPALADSLSTLASFRSTLRGYQGGLAKEAALADSLKSSADKATAALVAFSRESSGPAREVAAWKERLASCLAEARTDEIAIAALSQGLEVASLESKLRAREASIAAAAALTKGAPSPVAARRGLLDPYPTKSLVVFADEQALISGLASAGRELATRMSAEVEYARLDPSVTPFAERDAAVIRSAEALQATRVTLLAEALAKQKTAATALAASRVAFADAESTLASSVAALANLARRQAALDSIVATENARAAGYGRFLDAMNGDFDLGTWDAFIARYNALGKGINDGRDLYAKLEVDRLLADAQHSYDLSNFDASYDSLTKASILWKERYQTLSYPPLDFWLNLVRMARDTGNTRVIRQNDPLYREMTQYLSLARMKYDSGITLQKSAKASEAKKSFSEAQAIIANVTRTFPLNADAGFLSLQILKATNEADFRSSLPNRIRDASLLLKSDPAAGYARISDLSRIEPTNAQLARLLVQAEVATGKRKPEPTAAEKSRSLQLTDQARQLMKTGRQADLALAEQRLSDALALDQNNRDAQSLSLNIQTLKGGGPDKVLNVEDSRRLADARLYFSQGQYNQARDTLNVLLGSEATKTRDVLLLDAQLNQLNY